MTEKLVYFRIRTELQLPTDFAEKLKFVAAMANRREIPDGPLLALNVKTAMGATTKIHLAGSSSRDYDRILCGTSSDSFQPNVISLQALAGFLDKGRSLCAKCLNSYLKKATGTLATWVAAVYKLSEISERLTESPNALQCQVDANVCSQIRQYCMRHLKSSIDEESRAHLVRWSEDIETDCRARAEEVPLDRQDLALTVAGRIAKPAADAIDPVLAPMLDDKALGQFILSNDSSELRPLEEVARYIRRIIADHPDKDLVGLKRRGIASDDPVADYIAELDLAAASVASAWRSAVTQTAQELAADDTVTIAGYVCMRKEYGDENSSPIRYHARATTILALKSAAVAAYESEDTGLIYYYIRADRLIWETLSSGQLFGIWGPIEESIAPSDPYERLEHIAKLWTTDIKFEDAVRATERL